MAGRARRDRWRGKAGWAGTVGLGLSFLAVPGDANAGPSGAVRISGIEPARSDTLLVCTVRTSGLPDPPSRETLESGLPSSLVVAFTLLDPSGRELGHSQTDIRIEPDLWEETLILRTPLVDYRLGSIEELALRISELGPLPVLPLGRLSGQSAVRIQVRLAVHPIAPAEIERVRALFGGESERGDPDRREVSVGLGTLIRYFLGRQSEEDWVAEATSPPFTFGSLGETP